MLRIRQLDVPVESTSHTLTDTAIEYSVKVRDADSLDSSAYTARTFVCNVFFMSFHALLFVVQEKPSVEPNGSSPAIVRRSPSDYLVDINKVLLAMADNELLLNSSELSGGLYEDFSSQEDTLKVILIIPVQMARDSNQKNSRSRGIRLGKSTGCAPWGRESFSH